MTREEGVLGLLAALPDNPGRCRNLCSQVGAWHQLFDCAGRHGVAGVLLDGLSEAAGLVPAEVLARVGKQQAFERLARKRTVVALEEALRVLGAASIKTVPLKGPVLSERLYLDPLIRPAGDLDLLVGVADLDEAIASLRTAGYSTGEGPSVRYYRTYHYHVCMYRPHTPLLELHFRACSGFGTFIAAEDFLSRAISYRTGGGIETLVLSPEDEVLYLALHAAKHGFVRLGWLYDIKLLLRRTPRIDWALIRARAREFRALTALGFSLQTLNRQLGVPLPAHFGVPGGGRLLRSGLATRLVAMQTTRPETSRSAHLAKLLLSAALSDQARGGAWELQHHLLRVARRRARRYFPQLIPERWGA